MILPTQALYTITCHQGKVVSFSVHFLSHVHCKKKHVFLISFPAKVTGNIRRVRKWASERNCGQGDLADP